jgi:hypothetical protein
MSFVNKVARIDIKKLAGQCGMRSIVVETDVLLLKQALGNNRFRLSLMGGFICEIKVPIVSNCSSFMGAFYNDAWF